MTVAAVLVVYAACAGTLGARMLGRARWPVRAPLLAIIIYLAAAWSVVAALGLAGLTLAVHATALGGGLSHLIGACAQQLAADPAQRLHRSEQPLDPLHRVGGCGGEPGRGPGTPGEDDEGRGQRPGVAARRRRVVSVHLDQPRDLLVCILH